jgi:hypothetical protein
VKRILFPNSYLLLRVAVFDSKQAVHQYATPVTHASLTPVTPYPSHPHLFAPETWNYVYQTCANLHLLVWLRFSPTQGCAAAAREADGGVHSLALIHDLSWFPPVGEQMIPVSVPDPALRVFSF